MKKLPFILIIFFSLALFLVNTEVAYPICSDQGYEINCEGQCALGGKVYANCDYWSLCNNCRTCGKYCDRGCGAQCDAGGGCPFGSCQNNCRCCGNENDPDYLGCCPGYTSWKGLCCTWGEEVDCGYCHEDCPGGYHWDCNYASCQPDARPCDCSGGWQRAPGTGGCGNCGLVERRCGGCYWTEEYRCAGEGPCSPGQVDYGGSCGAGGCGTSRQDCGSNCQWGGGDCSGGNPSYGQACGTCGRGTKDCNNNCNGDYSNCGSKGWYNVGGCGKCGTYQRYCNGCDWTGSYQCVDEGPCSPGQVNWGGGCGSRGTTQKDCQSNCQWGSSYCYGDTTPTSCGSCGRGRTDCAGKCNNPPDYSNCGSAGWKAFPSTAC